MSATLISDKLKVALLQSAIQGKLTQQLPEDGDARDLLKQIKAEKERLINEKVIKKEKPLPEITEDEIPFDIPDNWVWVRLGNVILKNIGGGTPNKSNLTYWNGDIFWASVKDLNVDEIHETQDKITQEGLDNSSSNLIPKDTYVICTRMGLGKISLTQVNVAINQDLRALFFSNNFCKKYFYHFYKTLVFKGKGATVKGISVNQLNSYLFPLPPLAEQHRIVEAIETALAKIDKLKVDETKLYDIQQAFPTKLSVSLLQSAIQGKLTQQLPEDGDARDLLKQIEAEKERLINKKVIKKEKPLPKITEDEIPFDIPDNWVWVRLGDLSNKIHYGYTASAQVIGDIGLLRITDIQNNNVDWNTVPFCSPTEREKEAYLLTKNDIVIARTGGTIGKSFRVSNLPIESVFASYLIRLVPTLEVLASYIDHYLDTPIYWEQLSNNTMGTGQPNVNATALKSLLIPLPPLAEQQRIVEAIETALAKIDKLNKLTE